jgi:hypothetical protein
MIQMIVLGGGSTPMASRIANRFKESGFVRWLYWMFNVPVDQEEESRAKRFLLKMSGNVRQSK